MKKDKTIKCIHDKDGSVYIGYAIDESIDNIVIINPAKIGIHIEHDTKHVEVFLTPVCFPELISDNAKKNGTTWIYAKDNIKFISTDDFELDSRLLKHYHDIFNDDNSN
jgi:hypothetical protein